jgi:cytochrome c-type biogenesis protein CcmH
VLGKTDMILWLALLALTAIVLAAVFRPLLRTRQPEPAPGAADVSVYRDQLSEIESEHARGVMAASEANAAKIEISRRILTSADRSSSLPVATGKSIRPLALALFSAFLVMGLTFSLYLNYGNPGIPARPFLAAGQLPFDHARVGDLVVQVEARLRDHPEDGAGWDVIAPVYFKLERFQDAAVAYARAASLLGETVPRLAGYAEATVLANDGIVTEEARLAYERILQLEPGRLEPRFWLALAKEQDGQLSAAASEYQSLIAQADEKASWRGVVEERLAIVRRKLGEGSASPRPGPSVADITAAGALSDQERTRMIDDMVARLAERLKKDGKDLPGWRRLVEAYVVLGRREQALAALDEARKAFAQDDKALGVLNTFAKSLGLGS